MAQEDKRPFFSWSKDQHEVWSLLYARQHSNALARSTAMFREGLDIFHIDGERIPDFERIDQIMQASTGWTLVSTPVQFSDGQDWFERLWERRMLITEYIRSKDDLDYTPLPDIWHDAYGHLPFLASQRYCNLIHAFSRIILDCPKDVRRGLGSIWWHTIEFGLLKEGGKVRALGTGLMSSFGELQYAYSGAVEHRPFDPTDIALYKPSPHAFHERLWVLESFEQLEEFVATWEPSKLPEVYPA